MSSSHTAMAAHPRPPRRRPARRRPATRTLLAFLLAPLALAACDDVTGPEALPLTAEWVSGASGTDAVTGMPMSLELRQVGSVVTGTGTGVLPSGGAVALAVSGSITGRVVTLEVGAEPASALPTPLLLQAMLSEDERRLSGTVTQGQLTEVRIFQRTGG